MQLDNNQPQPKYFTIYDYSHIFCLFRASDLYMLIWNVSMNEYICKKITHFNYSFFQLLGIGLKSMMILQYAAAPDCFLHLTISTDWR